MTTTILAALCLCVQMAMGHTVISYPGWRGNNLIVNETFPYGMQWMYPCGGLSISKNRTYWPTKGGAVAVQPGWFTGHKSALMYINLGIGEQPSNYSWQMTPMFEIQGPSDNSYPGTFCLPAVRLPSSVTVKEGDLASIQVVEAAKHGAAMFNCVDIIFTDDESKIKPVDTTNCFNSSDIRVRSVKVVDADEATTTSSTSSIITTSLPETTTTSSLAFVQTNQGQASNAVDGLRSRFSALMSLLLLI